MIQKILERTKAKATRVTGDLRDAFTVDRASQHVFGPRRINLQDHEAALVCMLKNGAYYLEPMLNHHRAMGVRHFLFIDNGSDDRTVEILGRNRDVTIISNPLPVAGFEALLRSRIARRFIKGGWLLFVDSDELTEISHGEGRHISDFTRYCNDRGYNVVVGQCLDLFSELPLSRTADWSYQESIARFDRYSLNCIDAFPYHDSENVGFSWFLRNNVVANPDIRIMFGGIRREVFKENCALTNHRFVRNDPRIGIYTHPHCCSDARCADFTLLTRHYKFAGDFLAREMRQVAANVWQHGEDRARLSVLEKHEDFVISGKEERCYRGTAPLVSEGFLACSEEFQRRFPPLDPSRAG